MTASLYQAVQSLEARREKSVLLPGTPPGTTNPIPSIPSSSHPMAAASSSSSTVPAAAAASTGSGGVPTATTPSGVMQRAGAQILQDAKLSIDLILSELVVDLSETLKSSPSIPAAKATNPIYRQGSMRRFTAGGPHQAAAARQSAL
eukprot:GHVU01091954.1.p1 GENE.GHVU01091954.1~~GHVU01091954.1.p1  ORF type:complete len:147 (-),score=23.54 GHVU01091954.1:1097-1537(-)